MTMPVQKPGRSKQDYGTPWELIRAVETRWGKLAVDLAANVDGDNAKAPRWLSDAFTAHWAASFKGELCWLNPPFANIGEWVAKCKEESGKGAKILMLVPASIGSEWFAKYVEDYAAIVPLRPRLAFEGGGHQKGCADAACLGCQMYPKDCMLILWGIPGPQLETWRWK